MLRRFFIYLIRVSLKSSWDGKHLKIKKSQRKYTQTFKTSDCADARLINLFQSKLYTLHR